MNEQETTKADAPKRLTLDFASPEATIQNIIKLSEDLGSLQFPKAVALGDAEVVLKKLIADKELAVRAQTVVKITEGYVSAAIDADLEVVDMRKKVERMRCECASVRAAFDVVDKAYNLFKVWLQGQRPVGLNER